MVYLRHMQLKFFPDDKGNLQTVASEQGFLLQLDSVDVESEKKTKTKHCMGNLLQQKSGCVLVLLFESTV